MIVEKRRHSRVQVTLPLEFRFCLPQAKGQVGLGTLRNISLSGLYFHCPPPAPVQVGDLLKLLIITHAGGQKNPGVSRLKVRCRVVRLEPPSKEQPQVGVAVEFLEDLSLHPGV